MADDGFWDDLLPDMEMKRVDDEPEEEGPNRGQLLDALQDALKNSSISGLSDMLGELKRTIMLHTTEGHKVFEYIKRGIGYMVDPDGDLEPEEILEHWNSDDSSERDLETSDGLKHCAIADIACNLAMDDKSIKMLGDAMRKFHEDEDAEALLETIHALMHFQTHLGMAIGIGLYIDEEGLDD